MCQFDIIEIIDCGHGCGDYLLTHYCGDYSSSPSSESILSQGALHMFEIIHYANRCFRS